MSRIRTLLLAIAAFAVAALAARAGAQVSAPASGPDPMAFLAHVKNARFLAGDDLAARNLVDCSMPPGNAAAGGGPLADAPPTRIFDELYYLGTNRVGGVCVHFREPVASPLRRKGHSALTVTVADLDGLAAHLERPL